MTSRLQHVRLINLFRQGMVDRATSPDVNKIPVADQLMRRSTGPLICATQFSRCGRWVGRIRHLHRPSRLAKPNLHVTCINTQGLNWRLLSHAHKLRSLLCTARERSWNITMLSELHFCTEDWEETATCKPQVIYIEEFALIQWHRVGFLIDCHTRQQWELQGRPFHTSGPRIFSIQVEECGVPFTFVSIYAPVQTERVERETFFGQLDHLIQRVDHQRLTIGGDWNGHMGRDTVAKGLPSKTTEGGHGVQRWIAQHQFLQIADRKCTIKNRGTWRHSRNKAWYELDYFVTTSDMTPMIQHIKVQPFVFSDHLAKVMCIHPSTGKSKQWKGHRFHQAAKYKQAPVLDFAAMRGPTPTARHIRDTMQQQMTCKLQALLPELHLTENTQQPTQTLFVDGSFYGSPGTPAEQHTAGWGLHLPDQHLTFYDAVITDPNHPLWVGATQPSNNTGELTAMVFALMWAYYHINQNNITIAYDSTYAANCTQGIWVTQENQQLAQTAQHWLRLCQTKFYVSFRYVAAHTNLQDWWSINNEAADTAAKKGATGQNNLQDWMHTGVQNTPTLPPLPHIAWPQLSQLCQEVIQQCIPTNKPNQQNIPYSRQALQQLDNKRAILKQHQEHFHNTRGTPQEQDAYNKVKTYKRSLQQWARRQRALWIRDLCTQLDEAMRLQDTGRFYQLLRKLGVNIQGKTHTGHNPFGLEETTQFVEQVGNEHYEPPANLQQLLPPQYDIAWEYGLPPDEREVIHALHKMKDSKGGTDTITAGCMRSFGPIFQRVMAHTIIQLWNTEPHTWDKSIHEVIGVLLYKNKGSRQDLSNYRCIQLINVISRLLAKVVDGRIQHLAEQKQLLPNEQYGFCKYRSTIGPIMLVRNIAEQLRAFPTDYHPLLLLVDIRKAYPRVPRELAWQLFARLGFPPLLLRQLHGLHDLAQYAIQTKAGNGRTYTNKRGFREGCPSSPACFNVFHTYPLQQFISERRTQQGGAPLRGGLQWGKPFNKVTRPKSARESDLQVHLDEVLFADDTTIFTTVENHRADEAHLRQVLATWGEDLHADKTERIPLGITPAEAEQHHNIPAHTLQTEAKFLGAWIRHDASQRTDTDKRLNRARLIWNKLWSQLRRLNIPQHTKGQLFNSTVMASLCYSAEARGFTQGELRRMQVFVNNCIFGLLQVQRREMHDNKLTMVDLWRKAGIPSVAMEIGRRQLRWLGHVARMPDDRLEKQSLWLWLYTSEQPHQGRRRTAQGTLDTNRALWAKLQDLRKTLNIEEAGWSREWIRRATVNHGKQWKTDIKQWVKTKTSKENEDLWENRHAPGGKAERQAAAKAERLAATTNYEKTADGLILCPHCQEPFAANRVWLHARSCAVLPPERRLLAKEARERRQARLRAERAPLAEQLGQALPAAPPIANAIPQPIQPEPQQPRRRLLHKQHPPPPYRQPPAPEAHPPPITPAAKHQAIRRPAAAPANQPAPKRPPRRIGVMDLPIWWTREDGLPSRTCQWCRQHIDKGNMGNHEIGCRDLPYNIWLQGIRLLRPNLNTNHKCRQCGTSFLEARGMARHAHECRRRRQKEGLPLDLNTFHEIPPDTAQPHFRTQARRTAAKAKAEARQQAAN